MNTGLKPVWAGRNMRLDPFRLPQMVSYATRATTLAMSTSPSIIAARSFAVCST